MTTVEKMKKYHVDMSKGATVDVDIIPPPSFTPSDIPFLYMYASPIFRNNCRHHTNILSTQRYRQNPTVKQAVGQSGEILTVNTQQPTKIRSHLVSFDIPVVPSKPQEDLAPIETLDPALRATIETVKELFEQRPAWTRRAIRNHLKSDEQQTLLRHAVPYVGYIFRSGAWRDAIIKLGVDPRTSPEYRHYQTFMFRVAGPNEEQARDTTEGRHRTHRRQESENGTSSPGSGQADSHIFTGQLPLIRDGRIWMACDLKDPLLHSILYPPNAPPDFLCSECVPVSNGWFGNGTLGKVKAIMRAKLAALMEDRVAPDSEFERIVQFPDHASSEADLVHFTVDPATSSSKEIQYATEVRAAVKGDPRWRRQNMRESFGLEKRSGRGGPRKKGKLGKMAGIDEDVEPEAEQSEGEEEEMQRKEILEEQVAAAVAARDAAEQEDGDEGDNDDDDGDDVDESD